MLITQTLEKLQALRLDGMAQALEEQRHQNDIVPLSFEDRLALLVEREWLWRANRALVTRLKNAQLKINASLEDLDYRPSRGLKRAQIEQLRSHFGKFGKVELLNGVGFDAWQGSSPYEGSTIFFARGQHAVIFMQPPVNPDSFLKKLNAGLPK